jgi:hypothetical protein
MSRVGLYVLVACAGAFLGAGALAADAPPAADTSPWHLMWHGYAYLDSNRAGGPSGARDFESINHFMVMAERPMGAWTMSLLGTFSLEPATLRPEGSPLLFQRGETYQGTLIIDRQHAHDLFAQLAAAWDRPLGGAMHVRLLAAIRGEPTVGPEAFSHRASAAEIPMAPLSHHNLDSTHITDDVLAAGWSMKRLTIEGSVFHGAEPDENRWDLDQGKIDSYAGRLAWRPGSFEFQVSACRREEPEAVEDGDQTRQTASVAWEHTLPHGSIAVLGASGRNLLPDGEVEWGHLAETTWNLYERHFLYGRIEQVDRDLYELINKAQRPAGVDAKRVHVESLVLGYAFALPLLHEAQTAAGAALGFYRFDDRLDDVYGSFPVSLWVYLRFRFGSPGGHVHHAH